MRIRIKNYWKHLLAIILGMLGFASCEPLIMYGSPHADFKALGTVKDEGGKPIEGIRVAIRQHKHYSNSPGVIHDISDTYVDDTLFTDAAGSYLLNRNSFDAPDDVTIVFEDIDGEAHGGEFRSAEENPKVKQTRKGDHNWYRGAFEVKADVVLKKK